MKKKTFLVGLVTGLVLAQTWRPLAKRSIKYGIKAGRKVKELSQQALEDISDMAAEATEELSEEEEEDREIG
ncbi:MAG: DUF5132 domain-containing protein [Acidobacteria bacterium]|nr:DUF5132 domain-containing protein [Acidobacteriota bacterium]